MSSRGIVALEPVLLAMTSAFHSNTGLAPLTGIGNTHHRPGLTGLPSPRQNLYSVRKITLHYEDVISGYFTRVMESQLTQ